VQEVNQLLRQYAQMRKMFKGIGKGGGMLQRRAMGMLGGMRGR
jgi:signal recognition particle subunit SRP54